MEKLMRQNWWKALAVLILVYALVAGLLVPLKPNVAQVTTGEVRLGAPLTVDLVGYNTRFLAEDGRTRAWLNYGEGMALRATTVTATDDRRARLTFELPATLPTAERDKQDLSLIVSGPTNGTFVVPAAVTLRQDTTDLAGYDAERARTAWTREAFGRGDLFASEAVTFPYRGLLGETIRNTYFHVSLWFAMMFLFIAAVVYAVKYLRRQRRRAAGTLPAVERLDDLDALERADLWSQAFTGVGMLFGVLGLLTGAVWAKYTWGSYWNWDIKQFTTLIALLIYAGYFMLRAAFPDPEQRARLGAVYNIFAFACLIPLIYILPRLSTTSLHPGAEGNPAMGGEDLDSTMRMVFYPTIIGWTLFGGWMAGLTYRARSLAERLLRR